MCSSYKLHELCDWKATPQKVGSKKDAEDNRQKILLNPKAGNCLGATLGVLPEFETGRAPKPGKRQRQSLQAGDQAIFNDLGPRTESPRL